MFVQKFKKVFEFVYFSIVIILAAGAYIACDIGLGGAVDTEPPTGGISSPGDNAVIRDSFAIKGSWKDDGAVGKVTVALRNTSTNSTNTYTATVAPDGTWLCAVNPADSSQPLADGNYVATVTLYDNGGHTGKLTRSYTVDNTPPVVILSYLKSKDDSATEIKTYGKLFTLSGKAADDNNINRIDVKVYQDEACSTELRTITKLNVPAAIEQDVASFGTEEYSAIYGQNSTNSQVRYCKVFAYDDAQRYPADGSAQTDSDKLGNCQTSYYFQTTIEKLGYDKYKTNDLYAMFNGTYSNGSQDSSRAVLTSDEISTVKKTLTETAVKVGTFALNPENSPTYRVIGLNKVLAKSESMEKEGTSLYPINEAVSSYILTNGTSDTGTPLTITVTPGRDNYAIETSTVVAYFQECDKYGNVVIKDNNGNGKYVVKDKDGNIKKDSSGNYIDENGNSISYVEPLKEAEKIIIGTGSSSITSNAVSTLTYTGLETSHCYRVFVDGKDTQGNQILPAFDVNGNSQIYAFYLDPLNGVIELSISGQPWGQNASNFEPVTNYISSDTTNEDYKQFKVLLNYSYTGDQRLDVYRKENDGSFTVINDSELAKGTDNTYPILIKAASLTSDALTFTYKLENTDKTSYSRERSITVYRDNTLPEVTSLVIPATRDTSNTFFQFSGTAKDPLSASNITGSGIAEVWVTLYQTKIENGQEVEDTAKSVTVKATGTESWYLQINKNNTEDYSKYQTLLAEEGKKKIKVKVIDKVGLEKETTPKDWTYKPTKPIFEIKSYTPEGGSEINLNNSYSFNTGTKFTLKGSASDNYGIENITVTQTKSNASVEPQTLSIKNSKITYDEGTKEWTISGLPLIPDGTLAKDAIGKYEYKFTVTDKAGIDTEESESLKIVYDNEAPVISKVHADIDITNGSDNAKDSDKTKWYKNLTQYIKVSASDGDGSGIASVEWCTLKDGVEPDASTEWQPLTIKTELAGENFITTYNGSVVFTDDAAGNKLYIRATDNVGNVTKFMTKKTVNSVTSDIDYIVFNIDTSAPVLKAAYYEIEGISGLKYPAGTIYLDGSKKITVYGQYSDVHSGVKDLQLSLGTTSFTKFYSTEDLTYNTDEHGNNISVKTPESGWKTSIDAGNAIKSWKVEFKPLIDENQTVAFDVTGENAAGGKTEIKPVFSVIKDTEAPEIIRENLEFTITDNKAVVYMKGEKGKTGEKYYVNNTRDKFTLHSIATDNIALDSIELKAKDKDGNYVTISSTKSGSAASWTFSNIDLSSLSEKATLCVEVTDLAGNKNIEDNQKIELIFDTAAPKGVHLQDGKGKDIYFRIGNGKNDDNENVTTEGDKYNPLLDDDAGNKYSAGSYANTTNLEIRGLFDDGDILKTDGSTYADNEKPDVSGLKTIYYKVYTKEEYEADSNTFGNLSGKTDDEKKSINDKLAKDVKTSPTGTISPLSTAKEKRVFYTDIAITSAGSTLGGKLTSQGYITDKDGNKKHWAKILSNFNEKLTNFNEQNNYLVLVAEDNVGNFAVDVAEIDSNTLYNNFSLNVDTQAPVTANFTCSAAYTNASDSAAGKLRNGDIILTGTVADYLKGGSTLSDNVSELKSLTIKVGDTNNKIEFKIKEEEENGNLVKNYYINDVKQTVVPAAGADFDSNTYKDKENTLTTNKNTSNSLAVRKWKATIPGTYFAGLSGNVVISVIAKDNAGNEKEETAANVFVDSVDPVVNLNLTENTTVNGKQTLKGTISDSCLTEDPAEASEPGTLELFYTTKTGTTVAPASIDSATAATADASTDWRKYGTIKHAYSFEFKDIDTAKLILSGGTDSTTYIPDQKKVYFTVKATDKAGNIGFSTPKSFTVDQDTDRPVITFQNLTLSNAEKNGNTTTYSPMGKKTETKDESIWALSRQIYVSVSDDDGVESVSIMLKEDDTSTPDKDDAGWKSMDYTGVIWQYEIPEDGYKVIYFKVVDKASPNGVFISKSSTSLDISTPKICDTSSNYYGYRSGNGVTAGDKNIFDSVVYAKVDTTNPTIPYIYYTTDSALADTITSTNSMYFGTTPPDGWKDISELTGYFGGTASPKLYVLYASQDDNGIQSCEDKIIKDLAELNATQKVFESTTDNKLCGRLVEFDITSLSSGANTLKLKAIDRSGREFEKEKSINIDNNAPLIEDFKLDEGETVYGGLNVQFRGKARDEQKQTVSKVFFAVTNDTNPPAKDKYTDISKYISVGSGNWDISFDGKESLNDEDYKDTATAYHAKLLNDYLDDYYDTINGKKPSEREDTQDLYIWLYAEDSLGNSGYKLDSNNNYDAANSAVENRLLKVLPLADKPDVTIEYPTSGSTVGGTVRITGSTEIKADKVAGVYFQVDPNFNGTFCNDSSDEENYWYKKLLDLKEEFNKGKADDEKVDYDFTDIEGLGKVIKQTSGSVMNWTFVVNTKGEFAPIKNVNRSVAVRAYAVSDKRKIISDYKDINFTVDPKRPVFGSDFILEQRDDSGNVLKKMKYVENTWLSGIWHLTGSVSHTSGIKTLEIRDSQNEPVTLTHGTDKTTFDITVGKTSGTGKSIFKIYAEANTSNTTQDNDFEVKLQYDNDAPSDFLPETSEISSLASNGNLFKQYNGTFQLSGKITDADSGLKRIAFYFTRTVDGTEYFIDPMITKVSSAANAVAPALYRNNYVPTSELISAVETGLTSTDGLLWRKVTGASVANTNELTVSAVPNNVRVGSICKINNVIYRINAVSGTKLKLDGSLADATRLSVYFALAQIIDNTITEVGTTDVYQDSSDDSTVISNGDGDWMQEGIKPPIGNVYNWQASINSKNIYDGPVTLHFVYYDEAGNFASKTYDGKFCNNAPRIASITVATDYDGNGIAGNLDTEKDTYYVLGDRITNLKNAVSNLFNKSEVKVTDRNNESKSFMTLKGRSKFDVEIIGGNGKLWYSYSIGSSNDWDTNTIKGECATSLGDGNQDNDGRSGVSDSAAAYSENSHIKTIEIPESYFSDYLNKKKDGDAKNTYYIDNSSKDSPTWFCYKIWDETDGYTKFLTSQYVTMRVALAVDVHDTQAPGVVISPFKWVSADENSLYENSSSNGHIELSSDWINSDYYKNLDSKPDSGEYDADPKVSGKIVFRGSAWDNILLKELWAKISWGTGEDAKNFGFTKALDGENTKLAGYKRIAVYEKKGGEGTDKDTMVWKIPEADVSDGWKFSIDQNDDKTYKGELGSDGHTVYWTFVLDTEKLYDNVVCASDVTVSIRAVDSKNSLISSTEDNGSSSQTQVAGINNNKTSYQIDVVPYISGVTTSLSTLKNNNPSVYARTAQGHYPVNSGETVTLSGFNLGANTSLNISNLSTSGAYEITVNDIKSLNNLNNNNGKGSYNKTVDLATNPTGVYSTYANYYNRQPNNDNNNLLTDDIYFDVWQFKDAGISQSSGYITEPIMKVNPKNGMLNFGFNSGPANYCMANGQDTSYTTWVGNYARFSTCGFAVDENGNTHGITVGLDTNPGNNTSAGRMTYLTSKWGTSYLGTDGNYQGWNSSRIENIGAPKGTYNGVTFDSGVFIEDKLASPSLATIVRGDNTYVFLAYYDDLNAEIRFKWGNLATATNSYTGAADDKTYGGTKIGYCFDQFQDQMSYGLDWNAHTVFDVNKKNQYFSTIAGPSMTAKAGNYVSIDVVKGTSISTDVVVATWYDATANKWWYSYKKKPYSDNDMSSTTGDEYWSTPFMLKSNAGENCQIAVDKVGGIHIASYDSSRADLVYAYLSSYADTSPQVVTVDAYAFTGTNIRLDTIVSDDGKYIIPYIGYYMSSTQKTKMAYLPGVISADAAVATREDVNIPNGVDSSEAVTATWESSIIPSTSRYADNYAYSYVNVGLWKDADTGKAKPMTGTDVKYSDITGLSKTNTSKTFGNGTKNPVVAYATRVGTRGHLETAQMK